jgi:hypothetical protein
MFQGITAVQNGARRPCPLFKTPPYGSHTPTGKPWLGTRPRGPGFGSPSNEGVPLRFADFKPRRIPVSKKAESRRSRQFGQTVHNRIQAQRKIRDRRPSYRNFRRRELPGPLPVGHPTLS